MLMLAAILTARYIYALTMDLPDDDDDDDDDDTPQYRAPIIYEKKNWSLPSLPSIL
ncbi:hypothetical protein L211DRAFT_842769 [Terfezia boudieri ATCC MYA-4762]|uniref:Uncharacterized protein n=1 Tax=Terfezia boudieri ATCC MYA-4762 TaxID=1051890 RepID=A0A3N4LCV4_9PEZI|nr:hypothetical protein L211DRAFT_842769 [Terfezia boudieri ATCC MYA-4762]